MKIDYKLYLCTDSLSTKNRPLIQCVEDAILGGVSMVQVREKNASTKDFYELAKKIQAITKMYNIPIIINDRVDIALAINADGLHLGQDDMPLDIARKIVGDKMFIGISASNIKEAQEAQDCGADYVGVGPIFPTKSKSDAVAPIGLDALKNICKNISIPVVAIGGINQENARSVIDIGASGVAVISAILLADDIKKRTKDLCKQLI